MTRFRHYLLALLLLAAGTGSAAFWYIGAEGVDLTARALATDHIADLDNPHEVTPEQIGIQSNLIETAWQNPANAADWTWTSNGREITLTGYSGPNAVVIPDMLDGLPVTGFGEVFSGNTDITSVGGGANIKAVGDRAFDFCGALNSVSLPACTTVGDYAFSYCWSLNSVSLPACTTVGDYAFSYCAVLNSVSLPACTTVGDGAFYGCEALTSVFLPACTTVGDSTFYGCAVLNSVSLPACTTVGDFAFSYCEDLSSVTFGQNAPAQAADVFQSSTPTIYVSNPHATGWGDTWNGRPVVRAASMADIADEISTHNILAHNIYTPIIPATTTIAITSTQCIYSTTFASAGTITQSIAGLTVSGTQEARWELWVNATNPDALAPTWQANLDWQNGTPEMTVTGLYKFAMSTTGGRIIGRQTYPTVHRWMSAAASARKSAGTAVGLEMFQELIATGDTTAYAYIPFVHDMQSPTLLRFSCYVYALNAATNPITLKIGMGFPQALAPTKEATLSTEIQLAVYAGSRGVPKTFYCPALERTNPAYVWPYVVFSKPYTGGRAVITLWQTKIANELEIAAYNAGWRP